MTDKEEMLHQLDRFEYLNLVWSQTQDIKKSVILKERYWVLIKAFAFYMGWTQKETLDKLFADIFDLMNSDKVNEILEKYYRQKNFRFGNK